MAADREKIIDKALKLRELANRGIGGEMANAKRFLTEYILKYNITDDELECASSQSNGNSWYDRRDREEKNTPFAKWFKRSITIDRRTDKPLVFFHQSRTAEKFTEFDHAKGTKYNDPENYGFCFVVKEDKRYIEHIGMIGVNNLDRGTDFFVYLKMLNPYYIYARLDGNSYGQNGEKYTPIRVNKELAESLMWVGYDSIIIQDQMGINVFIVFKSNQIKSIDNNGEYSESNNIFE